MQKQLLSIFTLFLSTLAFAQVGLNTPNPQLTLDVNAIKTDGTTAEGIRAPMLTEAQLLSANDIYDLSKVGAIVYVTSANAVSSPKTKNITAIGYYYWDGITWERMMPYNIYSHDGTLFDNREVFMSDKTLEFKSQPTAGTSHFKIDGSTFSVNSIDNRVGIGTIDPQAILNVTNPIQGNLVDAMAVGISNCGAACAQGTARNLVLYNSNPTNQFFASIDFVPSGSSTALSGATIRGIDRDATNNFAGISFATRNATDYTDRLTIKSSGLVGVGTTDPTATIDINGGARIRTINSNVGTTTDNIVVADANGVLKVVSDLPRRSVYNTSSIAPGASQTLAITDPSFTFAQINIVASNACGRTMITTLSKYSNTLNYLGGQARDITGQFTQLDANGNNISVKFPNVLGCADGGGGTQFDFDILVNTNNITITNRGNIAKTFAVRVVSNL